MTREVLHWPDFDLAQRCLEQDRPAVSLLQSRHENALLAFLRRTGASLNEAHEIAGSLWADCLAGSAAAQPRLARYDGTCALQTWLNAVAFKAFLTFKRNEQRRAQRVSASDTIPEADRARSEMISTSDVELSLLELMREAIEAAFSACSPEDFVLLQLEHCDGLEREELATIFDCSESTISRQLESARLGIARTTLQFIRSRDPWLDLKWEDFVELCRGATPACFGLED